MHLILPASKKNSRFNNTPNKLVYEGKKIENGFDAAETFNNYFANVGKSLLDKIALTDPSQRKFFLRNRIQSSIILDPPKSKKNLLYIIITTLKSKKWPRIVQFLLILLK